MQSHSEPWATPFLVVREKQLDAESLESSADSGLSNRGYTLPFMKGNVHVHVRVRVADFVFQVIQRAYCDALMNTPGLELLYLGFNGRGTNGLVKMKARTRSTFQAILPHSEVEIYQEDPHSSYFRENPRQMLVYIKPIQNIHDWCNGIAVPIEHIVPVRMKKEIARININTEDVENISKVKPINDKPSLYPEIPRDDQKSP